MAPTEHSKSVVTVVMVGASVPAPAVIWDMVQSYELPEFTAPNRAVKPAVGELVVATPSLA